MMDLLTLPIEFPLWWALLAIAALFSCAARTVAGIRLMMRGAQDGH